MIEIVWRGERRCALNLCQKGCYGQRVFVLYISHTHTKEKPQKKNKKKLAVQTLWLSSQVHMLHSKPSINYTGHKRIMISTNVQTGKNDRH